MLGNEVSLVGHDMRAEVHDRKVTQNCDFLCQNLQRNVCRGARVGLSYFREFATDFPEVTKFGTINRFLEKNFCVNEKHKKSQYCVTS